MRLVPAEAGTGIRFRRTDLDGFEIPAVWRHVAKVSYATSLMREGVLLQTTEHLLSCLYASGIDNLIVEIDNLEVPIVDGSALPFVEMLQAAGLRRLDLPRRYLKIVRPVEALDGDKRIRIEPSDDFDIVCETRFDHYLVGSQTLTLTIEPDVYAREIAPARTFGFEADLDQMREMGLIRGATLDNAVCFGAGGVINPGGLRFPDEPCRHKLLDLIGDLAMLGKPLLGKVIATRAGHAMHIALVRRIMGDPSCYEVTERSMVAAAGD
jgi:UDP-3-O-[3-hydroxymyristoyl] N-acetylglucosamine deacetylase